MKIKNHILIWILKSRRALFNRLKGISHLDIGTDNEFLDIHAEMLSEDRAIQTLRERYNIYHFMKVASRLEGAVAEVGVYRGGSAKLLCRLKGNSPIYLFDTFEGLPSFVSGAEGVLSSGNFNDTTMADVSAYLSSFENVYIYKGYFPDSAIGTPAEHMRFRFVHLDVDIYESTLKALEFFYPRMVDSGIIISHDYRTFFAPGVRKAFDHFFAHKKETVIPLWDTQCVVIKNIADQGAATGP